MVSEDKKYSNVELNESGFTIIEVLVAIAIFSIMFMALTTTIWSATASFRTATYADDSIVNGQDAVEMLSVIDTANVTSPAGGTVLTRGDQKILYRVLATNGNFKTIAMEVYYSTDANLLPSELKMKTYFRRMIYQ
ncbi:MAG: prepilin-type N-terminal cleavage/methylation domain-containing protein [Bacteroidetes bacterium]|nr:prepilin-type N-terminal cleavage/methylation domain-containing protein [Bacteroidota bacterium]